VFDQIAPRMEVYAKPATAFVASFVGQSNQIEGIVRGVEGDRARLDWKGLELVVPKPASCGLGERVLFCIKYEDVELAAGANRDGGQGLPGTLRDVIFKGQTANYFVSLSNGAEIVSSGTPRALSFQPGEQVVARWPAKAGSSFRL
jgi:ABC-type Fe3+/spermidine/putrescine transport system ATPase subunit